MKIALWIIIGIIIVFGLVIGIGILKFNKEIKNSNHKYIVQFIKEKSGNKNVSLCIKHNSQNWIDVNVHQLLPLASTVKIILAIEFAQQAAEGRIDPSQEVKLKELDTFYIPKTDGGAHEAWILI